MIKKNQTSRIMKKTSLITYNTNKLSGDGQIAKTKNKALLKNSIKDRIL
jgi:hypothetical protein